MTFMTQKFYPIAVFTEKSSESDLQGATYSTPKKGHLEKLHLHCSTRGEILLGTGLWGAPYNDAKILRLEFKKML